VERYKLLVGQLIEVLYGTLTDIDEMQDPPTKKFYQGEGLAYKEALMHYEALINIVEDMNHYLNICANQSIRLAQLPDILRVLENPSNFPK